MEEQDKSTDETFFCNDELKNVKDRVLRIKCESAFDSLAISKREFYERAKISPQYWWRLSYGYDQFPMWLKKHLFREFGDCFAFLFMYEKEDQE
jgi:hypothetical protein